VNILKGIVFFVLFLLGVFSAFLIVAGLLQGARIEALALPGVVLALALIVLLPSGRRKAQQHKQTAQSKL